MIKTSRSRVNRPAASSDVVRRRMQKTRRSDKRGELAVHAALGRLGLRYRVDTQLPGTRRRSDVAFMRAKIAIFIDGCFWHGCPQHGTWPKTNARWWRAKITTNIARDRDTDARLQQCGWRVLRFWAHENVEM